MANDHGVRPGRLVPPPAVTSGALDLVRWVLVGAAGAVALGGAGSLVEHAAASDWAAVSVAFGAVLVGLAMAVCSLALGRRRSWARRAAVASLVVGLGVVAAWTVSSGTHPPTNANTDDGGALAFPIGAALFVVLLAGLVALLLPSARSALRPPPPGWYADPEAPGRRRWWSGLDWLPAESCSMQVTPDLSMSRSLRSPFPALRPSEEVG